MNITLQSSKELQDYVAQYRTTAAKKAALTRDINSIRSLLNDAIDVYTKRGDHHHGWLHGEKVFENDIRILETNIKITEQFKNSL
jgi:hypothetical protein